MTNPQHKVADAIREVTAIIQKEIDGGSRSRAIDADDLVEVLLAVADHLDPPVPNLVAAAQACPQCGERDPDKLVWLDDAAVRCANCGKTYDPGE